MAVDLNSLRASSEFRKQVTRLVDTLPEVVSNKIVGVTDEQIDQLESEMNIELPIVYRDFLKVFGKVKGPLFQGCDIAFEFLKEFQSDADRLLNSNGFKGLGEEALVFSMRHGYQFHLFYLDDSETKIHFFDECSHETFKFAAIYSSFGDYLRDEIDKLENRINCFSDEEKRQYMINHS